MSTELSIRPDQTQFDSNQLAALRSLGVQNASDADVALFFHQAARTGLDPFARQIYLINRGGKQTIQVGIDGFRLIRDRKGTYQGHDEEWCGPDGKWRDVWLDTKTTPAAARVSVYVQGYQRPVVGIALWSEYAQLGSNGKPQSVWASKPALMLAKCAEALALRKAYPQDLSGLYTSDEMPAAEQDADGVYVTTRMRETGTPSNVKAASGVANERDVTGRAERKDTSSGPKRPPRPRTDPVAGTADTATRSHGQVFTEWVVTIRDCISMDELIRAHDDAAKRGILDIRNEDIGQSIEDVFLRRRGELQAAAAGYPEPAPVDDDELY